MLSEFKAFIARGNVLDLAIGIAAFYLKRGALLAGAAVMSQVVLTAWSAVADEAPWPNVALAMTLAGAAYAGIFHVLAMWRGLQPASPGGLQFASPGGLKPPPHRLPGSASIGPLDRRDEPHPDPRHRLDIERLPGRIAQRAAQLRHRARERGVADDLAAPDARDQLVLRDRLAGPQQQRDQQVVDARLQPDLLAVAPQVARAAVEHERSEAENASRRLRIRIRLRIAHGSIKTRCGGRATVDADRVVRPRALPPW